MRSECRSIEERIQDCLDEGAPLADGDRLHMEGCPRCMRFYDANSRFVERLCREGDRALGSLHEPDWAKIVSSAGPSRVSIRRTAARWTAGTLSKAAVILLFVGIGALAGVRQYQIQRARSFLRSDTAEFVSSLVSSPLFPQVAPGTEGVQAGWFDASSPVADLSVPSSGPAPVSR